MYRGLGVVFKRQDKHKPDFAFAEIDDIFDVSDTPWENAKGVCLKKFSKALPQKAFITKGI